MISVDGIPEFRRALQSRLKVYGDAVEAGLKAGGLLIQRYSMEIVPVEFGPLRASAFTRHSGKGLKCVVRVGYTAGYAVYVHERLDLAHGRQFNEKHAEKIAEGVYTARGPEQRAKFLEEPLRKHRRAIGLMVFNRAQMALIGTRGGTSSGSSGTDLGPSGTTSTSS